MARSPRAPRRDPANPPELFERLGSIADANERRMWRALRWCMVRAMKPRFTLAELEAANDAWGCSCGPAALAAICGLTLEEVRPHFGASWPGYTNLNLTAMFDALRSAGARWSALRPGLSGAPLPWPRWGLARIQWEGPWTGPGASPRWAYRHTHWVGVSQGKSSCGHDLVDIWDVNTLGDGGPLADGWGPLEWWSRDLAPLLTDSIPRATVGWHITHAIEVARP